MNYVEAIKPIKKDLLKIFESARIDYLKHKEITPDMSKTCSANIVHASLKSYAKKIFASNKNVRVGSFNGKNLMIYSINDVEYQISLKKIDSNHETRNLPTRQTELFNSCKEIPGLLNETHRLNFGYQIDNLTYEPKQPSITCYKTNKNYPIDLTIESVSENNAIERTNQITKRVKVKTQELESINNDNLIYLHDRK